MSDNLVINSLLEQLETIRNQLVDLGEACPQAEEILRLITLQIDNAVSVGRKHLESKL